MTTAEALVFLALVIAPTLLTLGMFSSRNMMLGFPSAIFWALFGGYNFTLSTTAWDIYYLIGWASLLGMVTLAVFGAYGLRTKKQEKSIGAQFIDEGGDKEIKFIDERKSEGSLPVSRKVKEVRDRAEQRRKFGIRRQ